MAQFACVMPQPLSCMIISHLLNNFILFMLLTGAVLSSPWVALPCREPYQWLWGFRDIKVLVFLLFCFLGEERREVISKDLPLFLRPIKTIDNRAPKRKRKKPKLCVWMEELFSNVPHYLGVVISGLQLKWGFFFFIFFFLQNVPSAVHPTPTVLLDLLTNKWLWFNKAYLLPSPCVG